MKNSILNQNHIRPVFISSYIYIRRMCPPPGIRRRKAMAGQADPGTKHESKFKISSDKIGIVRVKREKVSFTVKGDEE